MNKSALLTIAASLMLFPSLVKAAVTPESAIDYSDFQLYASPETMYELVGDGTGTHFEVKDVKVYKVSGFYLWNPEGQTAFVANGPDVTISDDNPSCTLEYHAALAPGVTFDQAIPRLSPAYYDVTVDFDGENANLTFKRTRYLPFDPATTRIDLYLSDVDPIASDARHTYYERVRFTAGMDFYFADAGNPYRLGWDFASVDQTPLSPTNLTTQAIVPGYFIDTTDLDGWYYVTLTWNDDYTGAEVALSATVPWPEVTAYTGEILLRHGETLNKLTCVEPGIYEWSGERLYSGFSFTGPEAEKVSSNSWPCFDGTSIPLELGMETFGNTDEFLTPGQSLALGIHGESVNYQNPSYYIADAKLRLNLKEMTLTVDGTLTHPELDPAMTSLWLNPHIWMEKKDPQVTEEGIVYEAINMQRMKELYLLNNTVYFGWPLDNENAALTPVNTTTTLISGAVESDVAKVKLAMGDVTCDIYVAFNADQTEATLRIEPSASGVGAIEAEIDLTEPVEVYDLSGVKVGTSTEGLSKGVHILKQGAKRVKIAK